MTASLSVRSPKTDATPAVVAGTRSNATISAPELRVASPAAMAEPTTPAPPVTTIRPVCKPPDLIFQGSVRYRFLFEQMVRRELRQKYKGSTLGVLWYLINPLILMGAYALVFKV